MSALTWFLLSLVLLSPLFVLPGISFGSVIGPVVLARIGIFGLLIVYIKEGHRWPWGLVPAGIVAVAAAMILTSFLGVDPELSLAGSSWRMTGVYDQLLWLMLAAMLPGLVGDRWPLVWKLLAVCGGGLAVSAIVEALFFWPNEVFGNRAVGLTGNPGILAVFMVGTILTALFLGRGWYAVAVLATVALHLSGTRAALLALLGALVIVCLVQAGKTPLRRSVCVPGALVVLLIAGLAVTGGVVGRLFDTTPDQRQIVEREVFAAVAWQAFLDRPWAGWGPGTFLVAYDQYRPDAEVRADNPHNLALQEIAEKGLLSLPTFVFLGLLAWRLRREPLPLSILTGMLIYGLFWFASWHAIIWLVVVMGRAMALPATRSLSTPREAPATPQRVA